MVEVIPRTQSDYFKHYNPYHYDNARYGREGDTIVLFLFRTPTGRWSQTHYGKIQFNSDYKHSYEKMTQEIQNYYNYLTTRSHKREIKKGYRIDEIVLYFGRYGGLEAWYRQQQ